MNIQTLEQVPMALNQVMLRLESLESLLLGGASQASESVKEFLNVEEAAKVLLLTVPTIYGLCCKREIPFYKRGKRLYFQKQELENWVRDSRKKTKFEVNDEVTNFKPQSH